MKLALHSRRLIPALMLAALCTVSASALAAQLTGSIFTTNATGTENNLKDYYDRGDVYLGGGPGAPSQSGLPDGSYYVRVTEPGGALLGTSGDAMPVVVADGVMGPYRLWDIVVSPLTNEPGYEASTSEDTYKVWVSTDPNFANNQSKTTNFHVYETIPMTDIVVTKFYDLNVSGEREPGEVAIEGWRFYLYRVSDDALVGSDLTDANGVVIFSVLQDNTEYRVEQCTPSPYVNTTPTTVNVFADMDLVEAVFGSAAIEQISLEGNKNVQYWIKGGSGANPGKDTLGANFPEWAEVVNPLTRILADGTQQGTISTLDFNTAYAALIAWNSGANSNKGKVASLEMVTTLFNLLYGAMSSHGGVYLLVGGALVNLEDRIQQTSDLLAQLFDGDAGNNPSADDIQAELDFYHEINVDGEDAATLYRVLPTPPAFVPCE